MSIEMPREIRTERLLLRAWTAADAAEMDAVIDRNRSWFGQWQPWANNEPREITKTEELLMESEKEFQNGTQFSYGVRLLSTGKLIGMCAVYDADIERTYSVGYWLDHAHTGNGYITEALQTIAGQAFRTMRFDRLQIVTDQNNQASAAVAKRLGFAHSTVIEGSGPEEASGLSGKCDVFVLDRNPSHGE